MAQTRIQIINLALDQAGLDSSFQSKARGWFNVITEKLSNQTRYKFYNKNAADVPFVAGVASYVLPTDYKRSDTIYLVNSDGSLGNQIFLMEPYRFDQYRKNISGLPSLAMVDLEGSRLIFNNNPPSGVSSSYRLRYFRKPTVYSLDNTDDNVVPDFEDSQVLIQELMQMAYEHQDDERYPLKKADVKEAKQAHQRNMYESEDTGIVDLAHSNFRLRRRR